MRIVDLTLTLQPNMRGVSFDTACTLEREGWNARTLHLYSHCGTHMDAPTHFGVSDQGLDRIPIDQCLGPAWSIDLTPTEPRQLIGVDDLGDVVSRFREGDSLILRTDWSHWINEPSRYRDGLPRVSEELAQWCVAHKVRMLGVEPPSVADVNDLGEVTRIHRILLGGKVIIVEGLTGLAALPAERFTFVAAPLKVGDGDGAPCRAFAILDGTFSGNTP